ncbi:MAG: M56 family metallopeptidase [bacterium]
MLCILYVIGVGTLLGIAGLLVERALPAHTPRRWIWCLIIVVSIALPGYYRWHHAADLGAAHATMPLMTVSAAQIESLNPMINTATRIASATLLLWALVNAGWVTHLVRVARTGRRGTGGPAVVDGIPVVVTASLGPATVGFWHSRVLLPKWVLALPCAQRQYVVRHEEEHRRAHDGRLLVLASLLTILAPWNLALWWQLRRLSLAIEMDCDNRVVRALGNAPAYGNLLLKVAQAGSRRPHLQPALLGGAGMLEQRIAVLMEPAPLRLAQRLLLPAVAFALVLAVVLIPHPVLSKSHAHAPAAASYATARR